MTNRFTTVDQYFDAVCALGRMVQRTHTAPDVLFAAQDALQKAEADSSVFLPLAFMREAFSLTREEALALNVCVCCLCEGAPLPKARQLSALLQRLGAPICVTGSPLFFDAGGGCFHPLAIDFLFGRPPRFPAGMRLDLCEERPLYHSEALLEELDRFLTGLVASPHLLPAAILLRAKPGSGRKFLFSRLAAKQGCTLLVLEGGTPVDLAGVQVAAQLYRALVCVDNLRDCADISVLESQFPVLLYTAAPDADFRGLSAKTILTRSLPPLSARGRERAMRDLLGIETPKVLGIYRPNLGQLHLAAGRLAAERLVCPNAEPGGLCLSLLQEMNSLSLSGSAQRLPTGKRLDDLILPAVQKRQLSDICAFARARDTVYSAWGFQHKISYGRGLTALFYGASGTGKTMAASVLAGELGLELFRVDLSQLISKYIGETQKNIGRIFDQAQNCSCILFFDEADALFTRRSESGDSQDRYSNAEIAYLLQRTEQYDGILLLATNLLQNFDEAFRRRIGFMIHFPLPDAALRLRLWEGIFPAEAPVKGVDYRLLAEQLELSGAGIRNTAVNAAYLAASQETAIDMEQITQAARIEYQKEGKPFPQRLDMMFPPERRPIL